MPVELTPINSARLRRRRVELLLTQDELAKKVGVRPKTPSDWECADWPRLTIPTLRNLLRVLKVTREWLTTPDDIPAWPPSTSDKADT